MKMIFFFFVKIKEMPSTKSNSFKKTFIRLMQEYCRSMIILSLSPSTNHHYGSRYDYSNDYDKYPDLIKASNKNIPKVV